VGHGLSFGKKISVRAMSTLLGQIQDLGGLFFTCSQPTRNRGFYACAMCSAGKESAMGLGLGQKDTVAAGKTEPF